MEYSAFDTSVTFLLDHSTIFMFSTISYAYSDFAVVCCLLLWNLVLRDFFVITYFWLLTSSDFIVPEFYDLINFRSEKVALFADLSFNFW